jgi:hypothetical protein
MEQTRRINPMAKEYRVDCVLTEREKALLVALRSNIRPSGTSKEIYDALAKIVSAADDSVYDRAVSREMFSALSEGAIEIPNLDDPAPISTIPLNDNYTAAIKSDGSIKVGCQTIQFDALERVYAEAKRAKGAD